MADIQADQTSPPPKIGTYTDAANDCLTGIARLKTNENQKERVVLLLHAGKILGKDELASLSRIAGDE